MKNKELFDRTIGILVNAYLNDTLVYASCRVCAVGNIVAASHGIKIIRKGNLIDFEPSQQFSDPFKNSGAWGLSVKMSKGKLIKVDPRSELNVSKTGYSLAELALVEKAFCEGTQQYDGSNFKGLMSVVDTLMEIHEATTEEAEAAKLLFVKP